MTLHHWIETERAHDRLLSRIISRTGRVGKKTCSILLKEYAGFRRSIDKRTPCVLYITRKFVLTPMEPARMSLDRRKSKKFDNNNQDEFHIEKGNSYRSKDHLLHVRALELYNEHCTCECRYTIHLYGKDRYERNLLLHVNMIFIYSDIGIYFVWNQMTH